MLGRRFTLLLAVVAALTLPLSSSATAAVTPAPEPRIVGGVPADRAQTPWFALLNPIINGSSYVCGGTILSSRWILTAAHCVTTPGGAPQSWSDVVNSGAYVNPVSINSSSDLGPRIAFQQVTIHPNFDSGALVADIALIKTASDLTTTPLPYSSDRSGPSSGTALQVFGFGATSYGGAISPVLRMGNVLDIAGTTGQCGSYGGFYQPSTEECAGFPPGPTDSCQGDSGGPLTAVAQTAPRVAVGVVSYGVDCGAPGYPGVYARVAAFADWISSVTGVAPNSSLVGSHSGPALRAHKPCSGKKACKLKKGKKLRIRMSNDGGTAASWRVRAPKVKTKPGSGSLASGASTSATLIGKTRKKACVVVSVSSQAGTALSFKLSLNGGKCRG